MRRATQLTGLCIGIALIAVSPALAQGISGTWDFVVELDAGGGEPTFVFEQDGAMLSGVYEGTVSARSSSPWPRAIHWGCSPKLPAIRTWAPKRSSTARSRTRSRPRPYAYPTCR